MSERGIQPTDVVCITVHEFEKNYISLVYLERNAYTSGVVYCH